VIFTVVGQTTTKIGAPCEERLSGTGRTVAKKIQAMGSRERTSSEKKEI